MYTKPLRSIPTLISDLKWILVIYLVYLGAIYFAYEYLGHEQLDISMAIATVLGFSVALLLGFRTAASYDRWWEARKIWGAIVNDSRTLLRQLIIFDKNGQNSQVVRDIGKYQIAWCRALRNSLRGAERTKELDQYVSPQDLDFLRNQNNIPNAILSLMENKMGELRNSGSLEEFRFVSIDQTIKGLCDSMGMCERIKNTVFPVQYRDYTFKGILIFIIMLPYGMLYSTGPFVILICMVVAFFFFMIEHIAYYLQDPFRNTASDIPMTALCRTIEINLLQMMGESAIPDAPVPDEKGILM